jgi:REP element-mobilizing transposase RayT
VEVCKFKGVVLYAVNVRSNHVHVVVSAGIKPEKLMTAFKAYATRAMREAGVVSHSEKIWSRHGSTKYLWTDEQVETAIAYVKFEQGID